MLTTQIKDSVTELLANIALANVVKIDGILYIIKVNRKIDKLLKDKCEDFTTVFETDFHTFNWWEVREESIKINDSEWKIGENTINFFTIQAV